MPPKRPQPGSEQGIIPGLEAEPVLPVIQFDKRAAFGRVPRTEFTGIKPEELKTQITDEDLEHASPNYLRSNLFVENGGFAYNGILFRPDEYEVIVRSHRAFGRAVVGKTLKARAIDYNVDRRNAAAGRSETHAFEGKLEPMQDMIKGYKKELENLERLVKEMRSPGYAHMSEIDLRVLANNVREVSFKNIVQTVALSHGWDGELTKGALKALDYQLASEDYKANFRYWRSMTDLALSYVKAKGALARINHRKTLSRVEEKSSEQ